MRVGSFVKINFLVLALVLVIVAMNKLNKRGMNDTVAQVLGVEERPTTSLDWCDTRVTALERPGKPTIRQVKLKWLLQAQPEKELNFIEVEKWFGRNCKVTIERVSPQQFDTSSAQPILAVNFLKGAAETLYVASGGVYRWRQELFRSPEMDKALADLEAFGH